MTVRAEQSTSQNQKTMDEQTDASDLTTSGRHAREGQGDGRARRDDLSGASCKDCWPGYSMRTKATKLGLHDEIESPRENPTVCWYQDSRMIVYWSKSETNVRLTGVYIPAPA